MSVTLQVIRHPTMSLPREVSFTFGERGGTIGRSDENDWILPDPDRVVSSQHAVISCHSGVWYLQDTSTNGVFLNDAEEPVGHGNSVPLRDGDRLFIGDYEVTVSVSAAAGTEDPFAALTGPPHPTDPLPEDPLADEPLDPLVALDQGSGWDAGGTPAAGTAPDDRDGDASPLTADQGFAPGAFFEAPAASTGSIPDDWDRTTFGEEAHSQPPGPVHTQQPSAGGVEKLPENWDQTLFGLDEPPAGQQGPAAEDDFFGGAAPDAPATDPPAGTYGARGTSPEPGPPAGSGAGGTAGEAPPLPEQRPMGDHASASAGRPLPAGAPAQPPRGPAVPPGQRGPQDEAAGSARGAGGSADAGALHAFLEGAGIPPGEVPPEMASELMHVSGAMLREVVRGLIEVLAARTSLKNEFRIPVTMIRPAQNNPLKFSAGIEDALSNLLLRRSRGFLPPVEAVREGFDDIRAHQMALMAGMQAAFFAVLRRFDPERLEGQFEKRTRGGGLLNMQRKTRYWELYEDLYRELTSDTDEAFRRLFGEEFVRAYEEQMVAYERARESQTL